MRTIIVSFVTLFAFAGPLTAHLLVYKETERGFLSGAPGRIALTVQGYFARDTETGVMSEIGITTIGGRRYYIINTNFGEHSTTTVPTSGRDQIIISRAYSSNTVDGLMMSAAFIKGPAYSLPTGTGAYSTFGRSFKGITRSINPVQGHPAFAESSITMAFSPSETKKANVATENITAFLERWRVYYETRGYVPLPTE